MLQNKISSSKLSSLWSTPFILGLLSYTLISLSNYFLVGVLPEYLVSLGGSKALAGMVVSGFSLAALLSRPAYGILMDKLGRRPIMVFGALVFLLGGLGQAFIQEMLWILLFRVLQGLGFSAVTTTAGVVLTDVSPQDRLSESLGWLQIANALNFALGPSLGILIVHNYGFTIYYWFLIAFILASLSCSIFIRYKTLTPPKDPAWFSHPGEFEIDSTAPVIQAPQNLKPALSPKGKNILEGKALWKHSFPYAFISFLVMTSMACVITFIPLYGKEYAIKGIELFFPVYALASFIGIRFVATHAIKRWNRTIIMSLCLSSSALGMFGLFFVPSLAIVLVLAFFYGLGFGSSQTLTLSAMMERSPENQRGKINALNFAAMDIGMSLCPVSAGALAEHLNLSTIYALAGCILVFALIFYNTLLRFKSLNQS